MASPRPRPPLRTSARAVGLNERFEDALHLVLRDAAAGVPHDDADAPRAALHQHDDPAARRRELGGVGQEVAEDLRQPDRIALQRGALRVRDLERVALARHHRGDAISTARCRTDASGTTSCRSST